MAATVVLPVRSRTVDPLIVAAFIASLKVTVTVVMMGTSVAPLAGVVTVTVGGVVSGTVVNDQRQHRSPAHCRPRP